MKQAGQNALDSLEPLLDKIRRFAPLKEKTRGVFYKKSRAFLHFHEDPEGIFADVLVDGEWQRSLIAKKSDHDQLIKVIESVI